MAFIDELTKRMNEAKQAAQKAAEIARIQHQVSLKQDEFDSMFKEIGQLYYDCFKCGEAPGEALAARCAKVDSLAAEIEGLKLKLDDLKNIRRCTACGSVQNTESKFCANCGAKLEERVVEEPVVECAEPAEEPNQESDKSVFISWPEAEEKAEEPAEEIIEESKEESEESQSEETETN